MQQVLVTHAVHFRRHYYDAAAAAGGDAELGVGAVLQHLCDTCRLQTRRGSVRALRSTACRRHSRQPSPPFSSRTSINIIVVIIIINQQQQQQHHCHDHHCRNP